MKTILKKFMAATAILALFMTSVVSADTIEQDDAFGNSATVSPDPYNPTAGNINVSYDLSMNAYIYLYVVGVDPGSPVDQEVVVNHVSTTAGPHVEAWDGKVNGTTVADGNYAFVLIAEESPNGRIIEPEYLYFKIDSGTAVVPPVLSTPVATPNIFDADAGQSTTVSFTTTPNTSVVNVVVQPNNSSQSPRTIYSYNGATANPKLTSHSTSWDGKDGSGNVMTDGTYTIDVTAVHDGVSVTKSANVTIDSAIVAPQISNVSVTDGSIDPNTGETNSVAFTVTPNTSDVVVVVKNGNNVVRSNLYTYNGATANPKVTSHTVVWDGRDDSGIYVADGNYTVEVTATNDAITAKAFPTINVSRVTSNIKPEITGLDADPSSLPRGGSTKIRFAADRTHQVKNVRIMDGTTVIRDIVINDPATYAAGAAHEYTWDTRDNNGNLVVDSDGTYQAQVTVENSAGSDTEQVNIFITINIVSSGKIKDFSLDPSTKWDPIEEDLEIEFEITADDVDIICEARKGNEVIELCDENNADADDYDFTWDGRDEDDDYVDDGVWEIVIRADNDQVSRTITVEYEEPEIVSAFVSKSAFDPGMDEFVYLVYKVDAEAIVTVDVYEGSKRRLTPVDEESVSKNVWNVVRFDGYDKNGDQIDYGTNWEFRIKAEHPAQDEVFDTENEDFDVKRDTVSSSKSNVTNDFTDPVVFDDDEDTTQEFNYCLDDDADVYLAIYKGTTASGTVRRELLDYQSQSQGCKTLAWDGRDNNGKTLSDGIYSYKLVSRTGTNNKDTETGRFVIGEGEVTGSTGGGGGSGGGGNSGDCGGYWDVQNVGSELCSALKWATDDGIINGYDDGAFRPQNSINRAEVLRMTFEAYRNVATLLPADGGSLGFKDVDPSAWYMTYARTAKFNGLLHGYLNQTEARLGNTINRVELLKFELEAADAFMPWETPGYEASDYADVDASNPLHDWFFDYAGVNDEYNLIDTFYDSIANQRFLKPAQLVNRGETVIMLYRMNNKGLL